MAGKLDMMRVRATDPRPCPKCGKIYRSAHTLRTHMEDKHTICPGYRCVLCGTVAKSRNSLHSHMSRQHRGISTKDLPVLPMPSPFDADLAARLLNKAGVKVSPGELAARASPTAPRRSDLPNLDSHFLPLQQQQQFPLPASMPGSALGHHRESDRDRGRDNGDAEDLRVPPASSPYGANGTPGFPPPQHLRGLAGLGPKDLAALAASGGPAAGASGGMGSALLDTYLSMIAAAGAGAGGHGAPDSNAMAAALNFQNRFAAAAAAANSTSGLPLGSSNGDNKESDRRSLSDDREDAAGELGSDADNDDDISEIEDKRPMDMTAGDDVIAVSANNADEAVSTTAAP